MYVDEVNDRLALKKKELPARVVLHWLLLELIPLFTIEYMYLM